MSCSPDYFLGTERCAARVGVDRGEEDKRERAEERISLIETIDYYDWLMGLGAGKHVDYNNCVRNCAGDFANRKACRQHGNKNDTATAVAPFF